MNDTKNKVLVMQAHVDGKSIEFLKHTAPTSDKWIPITQPTWDWSRYDYRIKEDPIAPGHNPAHVTCKVVGIQNGWRLLSEDEIKHRASIKDVFESPFIELFDGDRKHTNTVWLCPVRGDRLPNTYRTRHPPGYFLPKPMKRVPLTKDDLPIGVAKIRPSATDRVNEHMQGEHLVISYYTRTGGITFGACWVASLHDLMVGGYEYSTDRVNWKPCYKEIPSE